MAPTSSTSQGAPGSAASSAERGPIKKAGAVEGVQKFKKTALCRFYPKCTKGEECNYAHSLAELRARPNLVKTRICAGYTDGRCKLPASECAFAHGSHDLRAAGAGRPQRGGAAARQRQADVGKPEAEATTPPPSLHSSWGAFVNTSRPAQPDSASLTPTASGSSTPKSFDTLPWVVPCAPEPPADYAAGPAGLPHSIAMGPAEIAADGEECVVYSRMRV